MELTRKQFDILVAMAESKTPLKQRELEKCTGHSLGTINRVVRELNEAGLAADGAITNSGLTALEPYRAKRVIFIAAGFGSRLAPITFNTPKPLVRVHGIRIIDRLIDACLAAGISEIYVVRGYLAELFDQLLYKYPMIKFLETPVYNIPGVTEHVQEQFLNAFVSFAKTGNPNHAALPVWKPCTKGELVTMIFDKEADARVNFDDELLALYAEIAPKFEMNFPGMENDAKRWLY